MEKTCTSWDIRALIRGTHWSRAVYLGGSTKFMLHVDVLDNALGHLDCSWFSEHNRIAGPSIWDAIGWFSNERSSLMYTSGYGLSTETKALPLKRSFLLQALIRTTKLRTSHLTLSGGGFLQVTALEMMTLKKWMCCWLLSKGSEYCEGEMQSVINCDKFHCRVKRDWHICADTVKYFDSSFFAMSFFH